MTNNQFLTRRTTLTGGIAAVSASFIGRSGSRAYAQTSDLTSLVEAAQKELTVTLYTIVDPTILAALGTAFRARYGITLDAHRLGSATLQQRFSNEMQSGQQIADLYMSGDTLFMLRCAQNGWFSRVDKVPGIDAWPSDAKNEHTVGVGYVAYSVIWNANIVRDGIKTWKDLLDPRWKGQVLLTDPRPNTVVNQWFLLLRKTFGDDYLRALGQQAAFSPSAVPGLQQVAAGAYAIYGPGIHQAAVPLIEKGAPLGEFFPLPTFASKNMIALVATAPHPAAARLFISFLMSPEGQEINNKNGFAVLKNIPNTVPLPPLTDSNPAEAAAQTPDIIRLLGLN